MNRCPNRILIFSLGIVLIASVALIFGGCVPVRAYRVRFVAIKTDVIVYETEDQVSRQCEKHIERWEKATGQKHLLDDGSVDTIYRARGCMVPPPHPGAYKHILTSMETIDNGFHELCHALGSPESTCDKIHFDGRIDPDGDTVVVGK